MADNPGGIRLSVVQATKARLPVKWMGQEAVIFYRPSVPTGPWARRFDAAEDSGEFYGMVRELIVDWEVYGAAGDKVSLEPPADDQPDPLDELPMGLLGHVMRSCIAHSSSGEAPGSSDAPSSSDSDPDRGTSRTGGSSLEPLAPSAIPPSTSP